ncbi:hypothetical protein MLD38_021443 [Melastoma candidum]|uniref:Uncharacterized protein n=1 Tax=Melastoma candidum TaxID=119954 RepID=A0ACB9QFI4_9MYRT|nr:hypothetical protein MLD38_021443 [Melastoma candidum]
MEHNAKLFDRVNEIAARKGCTPPQLALACLHHQGDDVCLIPRTTNIDSFDQNIGAPSVKLSAEETSKLGSIASADGFKCGRYAGSGGTWENSETLPLST